MCEVSDLCVRFAHLFVFFFASLSSPSPLSVCVKTSSGVSQPFLIHFWDLRPIFPHHPCVVSIPPTSHSLFSLRWKLNCLLFTGRYRWSSHTLAIFMRFFATYFKGFYLILIFNIIFQIIFSAAPLLLSFLITFSSLYLLRSFASPSCAFLASPPNRCDSLCDTKRAEAESCLCPFSLITSHLCVHKQTNTTINLRAWCRLRGQRREEKIR